MSLSRLSLTFPGLARKLFKSELLARSTIKTFTNQLTTDSHSQNEEEKELNVIKSESQKQGGLILEEEEEEEEQGVRGTGGAEESARQKTERAEDIAKTIFSQKFVNDLDSERLLDITRRLGARDVYRMIERAIPETFQKKKKNEMNLSRAVVGKSLSCFHVSMSAMIANERFRDAFELYELFERECEKIAPDVVMISLATSALRRFETGCDDTAVELFVERANEKYLQKRKNKKINAKKVNLLRYENAGLLPLDVIYEDDDYIAVNKTNGMASVTDPSVPSVSEFLIALRKEQSKALSLSDINREERGVCHRLDKATSGVMLLAKHNVAHLELVSSFYRRKTTKKYHAIATGVLLSTDGTIDSKVENREAISSYRVLEKLKKGQSSFIEVAPKTGRKHQIRVHLSSIGHPLLGDAMYTSIKARDRETKSMTPNGFFLHAHTLELEHPMLRGENRLKIEAPLPKAFLAQLDRLR